MSNSKASSRRVSVDLKAIEPRSPGPNGDALTTPMLNLSLSTFAKRPGFGTLGKQVEAHVNLFRMNIDEVGDLLEYAIKLDRPDNSNFEISGRMRRRIVFLLLDINPAFKFAASDYGQIIVSTTPLTPGTTKVHTYIVNYFEEEERGPRQGNDQKLVRVTLKFIRSYRLQNLREHQHNQETSYPLLEQHIAALNILLARTTAQNSNMTTIARREKFFSISADNGRQSLDYGLDVYKGYFRSARLTMDGLMVNVNTAASPMFWDGPLNRLITLMQDGITFKSMEQRILHLKGQLKSLRIETVYSGKPTRRTICEVPQAVGGKLPPTSANITFRKEGRNISVAEHFKSAYPTIKRVDLDAFVVNVGSKGKPVYIPSDLCKVLPGQPYKAFLPRSSQTTNMIQFACRAPAQNVQLILQEGLKQMGIGVAGGLSDRFKLKIQPQMVPLIVRMLPPPTLFYKSGPDSKIGTGSWNMVNKRFKTPPPAEVAKASYIEFRLNDMTSASNISSWPRSMEQAIRNYLTLTKTQIQTFADCKHSRILPDDFGIPHMVGVCNFMLQKEIRVLFVILPNESSHNYRIVKTAADTFQKGIHTICIVRDQKTGKIQDSPGLFANLAMKFNAKLGGTNLALQMPAQCKSFQGEKIMFIGADVVHPGQNAMDMAPSVAAVVATFNNDYSLYAVSFGLQQPDEESKRAIEFIKDFGTLCEQRLQTYHQNNKCYPTVIVVYRDGVADNMFAEVYNSELPQLQRTCKKLYVNQPLPKITFIICKKRGQTRFYQPPGKKSPAFDHRSNPLPGVVIDKHVTSGKLFDFFLYSHQCIQGTSRPAHYIVLHDDLGATADEIQYLTHAMCFLWPRATKSISQHPAARAADLACDRARLYLQPVYNLPPEQLEHPRPMYRLGQADTWPGCVAPNLRNTMFYI